MIFDYLSAKIANYETNFLLLFVPKESFLTY